MHFHWNTLLNKRSRVTEKPHLTGAGVSTVREETRRLSQLRTKAEQSPRKGGPSAPKMQTI